MLVLILSIVFFIIAVVALSFVAVYLRGELREKDVYVYTRGSEGENGKTVIETISQEEYNDLEYYTQKEFRSKKTGTIYA